jgi:CubicO group peptidase (beta-lactamase class C family)
MQDRILEPAGMSGATVADDPRGIVDDYAVGCGLDLRVKAYELPFGPLGGATPAGGTLAHVGDMASWVQLQLRQGLSVTGTRVVSAANLAECWRGHIAMEFSTAFDPDAVGVQYGTGWINQTYKGNTTFVQHNGSIDGFTSLIGFFPQHDLGLVVLTNMNTTPVGSALFGYVQNLLLAQWFGLNQGTAERFLTAADGLLADFAAFGRQARRPDKKAVAPWLGYYDGGFSLGWQGSDLLLRKGPRAAQVVALPDGDYVLGTGCNIQTRVRLGRQPDGVPQIAIGELETVRRQTG